jgi:glucose dehydrogenase
MTIPKPGDTGPIADTWKGSALALGGGATWTTGSADADADVVYWPVGNPHPDTDGDERLGAISTPTAISRSTQERQAALVLPVHPARPA